MEKGLSSGAVQENGEKYGHNIFAKRKMRTLGEIFREALCDEMLVILMIAAVISMVV